MKKFIIFIVCLILCNNVFADTIMLKSGDVVEGTIVEKTTSAIKVDTNVGVFITYYLDEIESIDGKKIISPPQKITPQKKHEDIPAERQNSAVKEKQNTRDLTDLSAEDMDRVSDLYRKAEKCRGEDNMDCVVKTSKEMLAIKPNFTIAHLYLATGYLLSKRTQESVPHIKIVAEHEDDITSFPILNGLLASAYIILGIHYYVGNDQHDKARHYLERATELDPGFVFAHFNLGVFFNTVGNTSEARKQARILIQLGDHVMSETLLMKAEEIESRTGR